jgi:hypothetical protein
LKTGFWLPFRMKNANACFHACGRSRFLSVKSFTSSADSWIMSSSLLPQSSLMLYTMENGTSAEMGLTGKDGVVGIALFMGGGTMPNRAVVQSAGGALRMKANELAG